MLIAVEGPPAVGKATLLRLLSPGQVVGEEALEVPPGAGPQEVQRRGIALQARR